MSGTMEWDGVVLVVGGKPTVLRVVNAHGNGPHIDDELPQATVVMYAWEGGTDGRNKM